MAYTDADLDLANRHVAEAVRRISSLEQGIADAKALGHPTELAESALETMRATLVLMVDHQSLIAASLGIGRMS